MIEPKINTKNMIPDWSTEKYYLHEEISKMNKTTTNKKLSKNSPFSPKQKGNSLTATPLARNCPNSFLIIYIYGLAKKRKKERKSFPAN